MSITRRLLLLAAITITPLVAACSLPTAADDPNGGGSGSDSSAFDVKPWG
ncbi:hypothetical protein GAU_0669 [Gemmatimonas aurantiaca T-27]|uniref:Uncharacterized protein n=1 Tax=Gemmatimonas aurantiaca (strain DSM 14586 / JCM 11422 / NBRC 100505 / T-27) TaxID=379066 RepID=C1A651_GEMAT|nr:hypothetical protein [Gemmatimonas aurantiaca]BAH37711.1 hypothetical protein GAU_0669 [Gemmatimonas aurantiaca T-27]